MSYFGNFYSYNYHCPKCGAVNYACMCWTTTVTTNPPDWGKILEDLSKAGELTPKKDDNVQERRITLDSNPMYAKPKPSIKLVDNKVVIGDVEIEMDGCHIDGAEFHDGKLKVRVKANG